MLPGWCCIAIAALELGNGDSWYHMCAFRFHFWGRKVNWNQASHVRASPVSRSTHRVESNRDHSFRLTAIPTLRMTPQMIQCYHLFSLQYRRCELTSWSPAFFVLLCLVFWLFFVCLFLLWLVTLFCFLVLGCVFSVGIVTACRTLYRSCLSSLLKLVFRHCDCHSGLCAGPSSITVGHGSSGERPLQHHRSRCQQMAQHALNLWHRDLLYPENRGNLQKNMASV